jgi:hypothetical protein
MLAANLLCSANVRKLCILAKFFRSSFPLRPSVQILFFIAALRFPRLSVLSAPHLSVAHFLSSNVTPSDRILFILSFHFPEFEINFSALISRSGL